MGRRIGAALVLAAVVIGALLWFFVSRSGGGHVEQAGPYEVEMTLDPEVPQTGERAQFTFEVRRQDSPVEANEVDPRLVVDMPGMPMGIPPVPLTSSGEGRWRGSVTFTMAGTWVAELVPNSPETEEAASFKIEVSR